MKIFFQWFSGWRKRQQDFWIKAEIDEERLRQMKEKALRHNQMRFYF